MNRTVFKPDEGVLAAGEIGSEGACSDGGYQAIEDDSKDLGDQGKEEKNMDKGIHIEGVVSAEGGSISAEEEVFVEGELSAERLVNSEEREG
ncbi:hypothetical protein BCIN_07g02230 [Botrytis cinerea B05.10]|uniref:Uncharacterized protein n=1 Tax=Botryotinia fuckeliana (strain B05.10) TaxID=332648 RepID=A0A384JM08_BOTFB|nr:hypothetical protein BCIN_07g02230 [Botrytis cinerea B05.10]ATZ51618.1 hypothetical protein BCIN_07g02230 [Botrytis cinerea B05.10]